MRKISYCRGLVVVTTVAGALLTACTFDVELGGTPGFDVGGAGGDGPTTSTSTTGEGAPGVAGGGSSGVGGRSDTPAEPAPNPSGGSASTCTSWVIDDFDGGATLETRWVVGSLDESMPPSVLDPVPVAADASDKALRVAMELAQPTSLEVLTHFHGLDPRAYDALTFRARAATPAATEMAVAVTGLEAQGSSDPATVTLTSEWRWYTIPMADLIGTDEDFGVMLSSVYRFTILDSPEIDVWLDDVAMVCMR